MFLKFNIIMDNNNFDLSISRYRTPLCNTSTSDYQFLENVRNLVFEHVENKCLTVCFIANEFQINPSTFYRRCKRALGVSSKEFVRNLLMEVAKDFLQSGKYNVNETSDALGFSSSNYFRVCFKNYYGVAPSWFFYHKKRSA